MPKKRTWPAFIVLALCGAPIFTIAGWKFVHDTPVESLTILVHRDGGFRMKAHRRWTIDLAVGRPMDAGLQKAVWSFANEATLDIDHYPLCPVKIAIPGDARAGLFQEALVAILRSYLWELTIESEKNVVALSLPQNEGSGHAPVARPRNVKLAGIGLPRSNGKWSSTVVKVPQAIPASSRFLHLSLTRKPGDTRSTIAEKFGGRPIARDLETPGVGIMDAPEWQALVEAASEKKTVTLAAPEDADLSGVDGVYILADADARAGDLVRALSFLVSQEGLKVYIVWPQREGDEDWWWTAP